MPMALLLLRASLLLLFLCSATAVKKQTYIVHMAKSAMPAEFSGHQDWYGASLRSVSDTAEVLYWYDTVAHGFSARLSAKEARALERREGVLGVVPEMLYELHTTRTPEFLGLDKSEAMIPQSGSLADVVVCVLDTGVWPERKSYDDTGLGPKPASWKGVCEEGKDFKADNCNNKLIGARSFSKGYEGSMGPIDESKESKSPRDNDGHGTHTSSTAVGSSVSNASLLGFAAGNARGMANKARLGVYKVCWLGGCFSSDILAAMDQAVADGCNTLSMSLGGGMADYFRDSVAIGAFNAMEKGVVVSCSAGNAGPSSSSLSNVAPWITTVGAGTLDRDFPATVVLGNGRNYTGVSLYSGKYTLPASMVPLILAGNASNATNGNLCMPGTLVPDKVAGKIVVCDRGINARVQKGLVVREAGGAGMILANTAANGEELVADAHLVPATGVGEKAAAAIKSYAATASSPSATIHFGGTKVGVRPSPVVAAFSSRGPNSITPEILKPDLIAPGVNILAAWTNSVGPTGLAADDRRTDFNIISGTSMSCPHVSGLAALLKGAHPEWSPAAIKSALMTTAYNTYSGNGAILDAATGGSATPFDVGAGHVDPVKALDPGVVYDLSADDYLDFLCALNYTTLQIASVAKRTSYTCDPTKSYAVSNLNYPSFAVPFETASGSNGGSGASSTVRHTRTLTNVGTPGTYKAAVTAVDGGPTDVEVTVEPSSLTFTAVGEKKSYYVKFTAASQPSGSSGFGRIVWTDGKHVVASPIAYTWT